MGLEGIASAMICGMAAWVLASWTLAVTGTLTPRSIAGLAVLFGGLAAPSLTGLRRIRVAHAFVYLPLLGWGAYVIGRAPYLPPLNHDALAYHFTRAALMVRAAGFARFATLDNRINDYPATYELIIAEILAAAGSDRLTEWVGVAAFFALLILSAAFTQRWWPGSPATPAVLFAVAAAPVILLASGADKNDLLVAVCVSSALLWSGIWMTEGGRMPMLLTIVSAALGVGIKPTAAVIAVGLLLPIGVRASRHPLSLRDVALTLVFGMVCFPLLGGVPYISNVISTETPTGGAFNPDLSDGIQVSYGDWDNLWRLPYLLLAAPYSSSPNAVWTPWLCEWWFWPRYEMFFSHFGTHFSLLATSLPFAFLLGRVNGETRRERTVIGLAAVAMVCALLPIGMRPLPFLGTFPRFIIFAAPVLAAVTLPLAVHLGGRFSKLITIGFAVIFVTNAIEYADNDNFAPFTYVAGAIARGGTRDVFFRPERAANVLDRLADADDTVAFLGGFDAWSYPLFGEHLSRRVLFLPEHADRTNIPLEARWLVIDRSWNIVWGKPALRSSVQHPGMLDAGRPSDVDLMLFHSLRDEPSVFELVYHDANLNQAVFRRRSSAE